MTLSRDDVKRVRPKPGMSLVRRDESPTTHFGLWIPSRAHASKRSSIATVIAASDESSRHLKPGDRVLLASSGGQRIEFGEYEPIKLEAIYLDQIMLRFGTMVAEVEPEHPLKGLAPGELALDEEEIMTEDEGEIRGKN